jgi:hypothetical protein
MSLLFQDEPGYSWTQTTDPLWIIRVPEVLANYLPIGKTKLNRLIKAKKLETVVLGRSGNGRLLGITKRSIIHYQKEAWNLESTIEEPIPLGHSETEITTRKKADNAAYVRKYQRHVSAVVRAAYELGLAKPISFKGKLAEISLPEQAKLRYQHKMAVYNTIKELNPELILNEGGPDDADQPYSD